MESQIAKGIEDASDTNSIKFDATAPTSNMAIDYSRRVLVFPCDNILRTKPAFSNCS